MSDKKLSKNERMVLYGLVKYPLLNDRELAEKLKLNISTLTAIKNRLKKRKYFFTARIPMLQNVGCELLGFTYFKLSLLLTPEQRVKMEKEFSEKYPEAVFMVIESDYFICISIAENFTEMKKVIDEIKSTADKYNAIEEHGSNTYFFPFQTTRILNFFDYAPLLQRAFDIKETKKKELRPLKVYPEPKKLTRIEKIVFYGLIKYPDLPDKKIAEYTNVTRQVVARLRKDFEKDELIKTVRIPNIQRLGFQIMGFAVARINVKDVQDQRKKVLKIMSQDIPTIFWSSGNFEAIMVSVMKNFDDYKELYVRGLGLLQKHNYLIELPAPHSLSVNFLSYIKNHDYAPLVKKIFNITEVD
jgi:DNA-binding MarR family transcriptional regulator